VIAAAVLFTLAAALAAWLWHKLGRAWWLVLAWRWHSGHSLDGQHRTNATWTRRSHGDRPVLHPAGHAVRWHHWPRLHRAGIRCGSELVLFAVLYGLIAAWTVTLAVLAAAGAGLALLGGWLAYGRLRNWRHNRDWIKPLNLALPPDITVRELTRDRTRAVLALPAGFTGDEKDRKLILQAATAKLNPAAELKGAWSLHGKNPQVEITLIKPPPGFVGFPAIRPYADDAEEHQIVFGLGHPTREFPEGAPATISVKNESPHIGLSMSSGDGKSVAVRNASCQLAHHGAIIAVLDPKLISQHWAAGLRNVAYARTPAEMHELAIWLAGEVDRRNDVVLYSADVEGDVQGNVGPRVIGILEELNVAQMKLATYWKEELDGKGKSPAVLALDLVSASGRAVDVNLLYVGQRLSAKATSAGSGDSRENLGVLLMSNPAASTWKMLVGDRHALPPGTDVQGRLQIVAAKTVTEVQGAYVTGAQARAYATSGIVAVPRDDMPCVGGLAPMGTPERAAQDVTDIAAIDGNGPDLHIVRNSPELSPPPPTRITIPDAVAEGISGPTYDAVRIALRRARKQGLAVPEPVGIRGNADEYDRTEWCDWEEARRQPRRLTNDRK
jgi:hypothetical protein